MKRIIASAGCIVLGAAAVQAANDIGLSSVERTKPWSISATLRGFYDDNYATVSKNTVGGVRSSYGFDLNPSAKWVYLNDQTQVGLSYAYDMRYYEDRDRRHISSADHSHVATFTLDHRISEAYKFSVKDQFTIAQEPGLVDAGTVAATPFRSDGNNIHNNGSLGFTANLSPELTLALGYSNNLYDYQATGPGSLSALLDRTEHLASLTGSYALTKETSVLLGYQFGLVDYSSKDKLDDFVSSPSIRNNTSHYVFVGVDHRFTPELSGSVKVGGQFTDYRKLHQSSASPYADASLSWIYSQGTSGTSSIQLGVRNQRNQTDVGFLGGTLATSGVALDQESTTVYGSWTHQILPSLTGNLMGQYQNSSFKGGNVNGATDNIYTLGLSFSYQINQFLSAVAGYNYDKLSDNNVNFAGTRAYDRNRVFLGISANY